MDEISYKYVIGQKIKQIRNSQNLTQESFCNEINLEVPNLSNIENGKSFPSLQTLINIITRFKIEPNDIFDIRFYNDDAVVDSLLFEYLNRLPFNKKVMTLKMIMLINEEDKK